MARTPKTRLFFSGLFQSRKPASEARILADEWATRTISRLETRPFIHARSTPRGIYLAVLRPFSIDSVETYFTTPRGLECALAISSASTLAETTHRWTQHLNHFATWIESELANPRD
jgi:hypothetical protein